MIGKGSSKYHLQEITFLHTCIWLKSSPSSKAVALVYVAKKKITVGVWGQESSEATYQYPRVLIPDIR